MANTLRGQFIEDCADARVVLTDKGEALLIGGLVLQVSGPPPTQGDAWLNFTFADVLASALRRRGSERDLISSEGKTSTASREALNG